MTAPDEKREIVIEFEKVQMIRKRARAIYTYCRRCGGEKDFVGMHAAAALFDITVDQLSSFVSANSVHVSSAGAGGADLCVASLLEAMQSQQNRRELKLLVSKNRALS